MTCSAVTDAVSSDSGEPVSRQQALAGQPRRGHYVALLARPESCIKGHCYEADFHAMRKDSSGSWSWKHPGMPATNRQVGLLPRARHGRQRMPHSAYMQPGQQSLTDAACASARTFAAAALPKHRDLFGALVFDPEAAALLGSYQVCGYFRVEPQKVRLSPQRRAQCVCCLQCC